MPSLETVIASTLGMPEATITDEHLPDARFARGSSAAIAPATTKDPTVHRGLDGVTFDRTTITKIDSEGGALLYRGYSVGELVSCSDFEQVAYLLLHGELPSPDELAELRHELRTHRRIPDEVIAILRGLVAAHPMDALRTAVSALATFDPDRHDSSPAATLRKGLRLIAQMPTIVATFHTLRQGDRPRMPREDLDPASDFMYQLFGGRPTQETRDALHADFILHADHGANASTFTARVVTGTGADVHAAVTAAIAAFAGPLHGGAVENVLAMAREIGHPSRAADYVRACRAAGKPVMGFGHRIYKVEDPRARELLALAEHLAQSRGERLLLDTLLAVVEAMQPQASHGLVVNVDLYASVVYHLLGIPDDLSVPVFVVGRIAGWIAQVLEQQSANILIRPRLAYVGTPRRSYPR
jgi:citrate synthase